MGDRFRAGICLSLTLSCLVTPTAAEPRQTEKWQPDQIEFFEKHIRPALVNHCYQCHSGQAKKAEGNLRLDARAQMLKGGDDGPAIKPGNVQDSLLIQAIRYGKDSYQMPPGGKLPPDIIADFEKWIAMGAPDPRIDESPVAASATVATKEQRKSWAFQPPRRASLPAVKNAAWPKTYIDRLILAKLEQKAISPSSDTDRHTWLRRVTFDLVGLPPSPAEVQAFSADSSPEASQKVVDRLLASKQFGERWARHWLDVARYADTKGYVFQEDRNYKDAYKYRDWVVRAFNEDLPYDRFLVAQLAADQLPTAKNPDELAAMGFLTLGRRFINNIHDIVDDRIDVVTRGTMALTVSCARCHDHKYDPIPTEDYYSLYGVFASSEEPKKGLSTLQLVDSARPHNAKVLLRGNPGNLGKEVPRQFLKALAGEGRKPFEHGSGRLELARAIASPTNPLTARVFVNRVWGHLFGIGLVQTPSDFGSRSDPPSHPELLDYLALRFVEQGWSTKKLLREIVLSRVYAQKSDDRAEGRVIDPENRLLWRMNRRRLDFEAMRDALLATSGQLDLTIGGPPVQLATQPFTKRRTIYGFIERQNLPGVFRTFDFASPDTHAPQRFQTTVPQQALFFMNSPFLLEQAAALVQQAQVRKEKEPARKIEALYRTVFSRDPTTDEKTIGLAFVKEATVLAAPKTVDVWQRYAQTLLWTNEFLFVD